MLCKKRWFDCSSVWMRHLPIKQLET